MKGLAEIDALLAEAIQAGRLRAVLREAEASAEPLDEAAMARLAEAREAVAAIDAAIESETTRLDARLRERGVEPLDFPDSRGGRPFHAIAVDVALRDVDAAARAIEAASYRRLAPEGDAAWRALCATRASCGFVRTDREPYRVDLRWEPRFAGPLAGPLGRLLAPQASDLEAVRLPGPLWPAYSLVRLARLPLRLFARGLVTPDLGPFLTTPDALVLPLLRFADVTPDDLVVDLGCGDGRIPIRAAQAFGCRARGVEIDNALAARARAAADDAGVGERVTIVSGDASRALLEDATVVVVFLPAATVERLVPRLLERLRPGARVVAHEQFPLRALCARKAPLFSAGGLTVVHRWDR